MEANEANIPPSPEEVKKEVNSQNQNIDANAELGQKIASASWDDTIKIWDTTPGLSNEKCLLNTLQGHTWPVRCLVKLSENKIASGGYDKKIKIWDITPGLSNEKCLLNTLQGQYGDVNCLVKLTDNKIASGTDITEIWDINENRILNTFEGYSDIVSSLILL